MKALATILGQIIALFSVRNESHKTPYCEDFGIFGRRKVPAPKAIKNIAASPARTLFPSCGKIVQRLRLKL
jgi:hypothetical protein